MKNNKILFYTFILGVRSALCSEFGKIVQVANEESNLGLGIIHSPIDPLYGVEPEIVDEEDEDERECVVIDEISMREELETLARQRFPDATADDNNYGLTMFVAVKDFLNEQ